MKSKKLDSMYGEYLRKIMLHKLNNPSYVVPALYKSSKPGRKIYPKSSKGKRVDRASGFLLPAELKNEDWMKDNSSATKK